MKKILYLFLCLSLCLGLCSCQTKPNKNSSKPVVAVTIMPQAAFVKEICGDTVEVVTMVPSGASPESYEPTIAEMQKLEDAVIYFAIGVPSEEGILPSVKKETEIVYLHKAVAEKYADLTEHSGRDPHIWLSAKRVKVMVEKMTESLCGIFKENAEIYQINGKAFEDKLTQLDTDIKEILSKSKSDSFIAFHPAFNYFANDYGLTMYSLEEHGKEATAKHIAEVVDIARLKGIRVIFYQAEASARQAKSFAEEIGGEAVELEPLSPNYIDNLLVMANHIAKVKK